MRMPFEGHAAGEGGLGIFDVAAQRVVDAHGLADLVGGGPDVLDLAAENQALDLILDLVVELVAVGAEELDAVVVVRIVRGGDDDAGIGAEAAGDVGDPRRGQRADEQHIHAHREDAGGEGVLEHVAGKAGVFAQHNLVAAPAAGLAFETLEDMAGGAAKLEGGLGGDRLDVGGAANAIGAEDFLGRGHWTCSVFRGEDDLHFGRQNPHVGNARRG